MNSRLRHLLHAAGEIEPELHKMREHFHRYPELSGEEYDTSRRIIDVLSRAGYEIMDLGLETGVVARLRTDERGPTVAVRADIDALPMTEKTGLSYASTYPGRMHACGHDAHITWGLGAAMLLANLPERPPGEIRLLFQPSEEKTSGARVLIDAGALDGVEYIFGGHNKPDLPAGVVGISEGYLMATSGRFAFRIVGKGGHGAIPHLTHDPMPATGAILSAIQTIVARNVDPLDSAVISVGSVHGGTAGNIIPPEVEITGTMRSFRPEVADLIEERLRGVAEAGAATQGCSIEWDTLKRGVPAVCNDSQATHRARSAVEELLGSDHVVPAVPVMASEDFSLYQERVPGCFLWIGSGYPSDPGGPGWHHPEFSAAPECIPTGAAVLAATALGVLLHPGQR